LSIACYGTFFEQKEIVGQENPNKFWMPEIINDVNKKRTNKQYTL
jgi:hypothetical protein